MITMMALTFTMFTSIVPLLCFYTQHLQHTKIYQASEINSIADILLWSSSEPPSFKKIPYIQLECPLDHVMDIINPQTNNS